MKTILETKRLLLREMGEDDFAALKKVIFDPGLRNCGGGRDY